MSVNLIAIELCAYDFMAFNETWLSDDEAELSVHADSSQLIGPLSALLTELTS